MDLRITVVTVILAAAVCLTLCANAQTGGGQVLTLDEAVSLARANNRGLKQSGLEISKQTETLSAAKTQLYPRFDATVLAAQQTPAQHCRLTRAQSGTL